MPKTTLKPTIKLLTPKSSECEGGIQLENINIMTKNDLSCMKVKKIARVLVSTVEYLMAMANATGSQSNIVHYCMALYLGQLIFRTFEMIE